METTDIEKQLADLLPDRVDAPSMSTQTRPELIKKEASDIKTRHKAKELAALRYKESRKLHSLERKQAENEALAKELGLDEVPLGQTENQARKIAEQKNKVETIKAIEAQADKDLFCEYDKYSP